MKYNFNDYDDVYVNVNKETEDEMSDETAEVNLKIDLKIIIIYVFDEIADEVNDEVNFKKETVFNVKASFVNKMLSGVSMFLMINNENININDINLI